MSFYILLCSWESTSDNRNLLSNYIFDMQICWIYIGSCFVSKYWVCTLNKVCLFICLNFSKKTKLLLCSSTFQNEEDLLNHYVSYHNVDENNCFFFRNYFNLRINHFWNTVWDVMSFLLLISINRFIIFWNIMMKVRIFLLKINRLKF